MKMIKYRKKVCNWLQPSLKYLLLFTMYMIRRENIYLLKHNSSRRCHIVWVYRALVRLPPIGEKNIFLKLFHGDGIDAVFHGLSEKRANFVGPSYFDTYLNEISLKTIRWKALVLCSTVLSGSKNLSRPMVYIQFCRKFIFLTFDTNRAWNGWTMAEKSEKYWKHPIFMEKLYTLYSHGQ